MHRGGRAMSVRMKRSAQPSRGSATASDSAKRASGGGAPFGMIAFSAVVGVLVAGMGGLVLWRRLGG